MKSLRGTYVHRGDVERRRRRIRAGFMILGLVAAGTMAARNWEPDVAVAAGIGENLPATAGENLPMRGGMAATEAEHGLTQLKRWHNIFNYSRRYHISSDLAAAIYDAALAERIDPALAFPLVRLESRFNEKARSSVGAIGLTQLMLSTARYYEPGVTREQLYERDRNLRIGFRYLNDLLEEYRDVGIALLVYNRGPTAVNFDRKLGIDPSNGYDRIVLRGYRGKGLIEAH